MNNIKIIATDMDGTFLNSQHEISPDFPAIFEELKKRNILFVPASGRQMSGIKQYFRSSENDMGFIAENGAYIICKGEELFSDELSRQSVLEIIMKTREISGAETVLSAKKRAYYESNDDKFIQYFTRYYTENQQIDDLTAEIDDVVFKIAIYHPEGADKKLFPYLEHFKDQGLEVVISGEFWVDIMNKHINKGQALKIIQEKFDILPSETLAFGDYLNDVEMLEKSEFSFAMENAHPSVKQIARFSTSSNNDFGVTEVIGNYLDL